MDRAALDRLVDACLLPGFVGDEVPAWVRDALDDGLAGLCLYGHNLTGDDAVRRLATALREQVPDALVAIDEEGGDVTRLDYRRGSAYPGNLALGAVDDTELTRDVAHAIGVDLADAGVSFNLAPSVDVNSDSRNPVIGVRSFGADPARVSAHGAAYVEGLQRAGVAACAKHFPGHGATVADSHLELPTVTCDRATFETRELPPFAAAIAAGTQSVMTSHVLFPQLSDEPATLSRTLLVDVLRGDLRFEGVIVTDALDMAGVRARHGIAGAAVLSLAAGADLLCVGAEDGAAHRAEIHTAVATAVADGTLTVGRLEEAGDRVRRLRAWTLSAERDLQHVEGVGLAAARRAVRTWGSARLAWPAVVVELRGTTNLAVGEAAWSLAEPLRAVGFARDAVTVSDGAPLPLTVAARAGDAPIVVAVRDAYRSSWQRAWLTDLFAVRPDTVLVSLGMPDDQQLAGDACVMAYGAGRVNALAAAELLAGAR